MKERIQASAQSFAQQIKQEILSRESTASCCAAAAAYGFFCFSKTLSPAELLLHTETVGVAKRARELWARMGAQGKIYVRGSEESRIYELAVRDSSRLKQLYAYMKYSPADPALRIHGSLFQCEQCIACFSAAAFLASGTATDPQKEYNLEFITARWRMLQDFAALLTGRGFYPKTTQRKGHHILYFKASEQIEDMLTMMGAQTAAMEIMSTKVFKDFRNKANRITNCETANIDKIVTANAATLKAISCLRRYNALESLPDSLKEAARIREAFPDLALRELTEKFVPPLSKSGISHRMKKLEQIAAQIQERISHE